MFGWFQPKCPIADDIRDWIEWRAAWIVKEFGANRIRAAEVVLPIRKHFPDPYSGSERDVRALLDRVCKYMRVAPERVELELFTDPSARTLPGLAGHTRFAAGLYDEGETRTTIWIETGALKDAHSIIATLAHEVAHVHLLGDKRIASDADDHEPLTDLLTVFLGLGVFTANAVFQEARSSDAHYHRWSLSKLGYLTAPMYGYALALFAWRRDEAAPAWAKHLRADVRGPFREGLRYLAARAEHENRRFPLREAERTHQTPAGVTALSSRNENSYDTEEDEPEEPRTGADDDLADASEANPWAGREADYWFTKGVAEMVAGDHEAAVDSFTESLEVSPNDAETLEHRGMSLCMLGDYEEALRDCQEALRLESDNSDIYRTRGRAWMGLEKFDHAIADFSVVLQENDEHAEAYFLRGLSYAAVGQHRPALKDFDDALQAYPTAAEIYWARAESYEELGKTNQAAADRAEAIRRDPLILKRKA